MCGNQVFIPTSPSAAPPASIMANFESPGATLDFKSNLVMTGILNAHIETLVAFKDTAKATPLKTISESVLSILTIVRDKMIEEDLFVELAEISGRTFQALKHVAEQEGANDLSCLSVELESFGRTIRAIESVVRVRAERASYSHEPQPGFTEERAIAWQAELWELFDVFEGALRQCDILGKYVQSPVDAGLSAPASPTPSSVLSPGELLPPPSPRETGRLSQPSRTLDPDEQALQRLVGGALSRDEQASVIESIFSSRKVTDMARDLQEKEAQTFIDVVHETLDTLNPASGIRRTRLKVLYRTCAHHASLPKSLRIELPDISTGPPLRSGGFGDVWRREYEGQEVAVKVLRRSNSHLKKITHRFCKEVITWKALRHQNVLPLLGVALSATEFAMVSKWMSNGDINQFVREHLDANRFELLEDVARGLIYMHEQGMVHGDLKGANVLIDDDKHARLADFGLLTIVSDTNLVSSVSFMQGGTHRWMSPELLDPESCDPETFDPKAGCPTKRSDCYALGMVIYEVLSGKIPFSQYRGYAVVGKVIKGERPGRPEGEIGTWFTDEVWGLLGSCWEHIPKDRPKIGDVLQRLENASRSWIPTSQTIADPPTENWTSTKNSDRSDSEESVGTLGTVFQIKTGKGKATSPTTYFFFFSAFRLFRASGQTD